MDATFRPKKSDLYTMLGLLPLSLAWGGVTLRVAAFDPTIRSRLGFAAMALVPFGMAGLCAGAALDYARSSLTFRAGRLIFQGLRKRSEMDLADVTEARWGPGSVVKLRDASSRLKIDLREYERPDRERIVAHLHATLPPEAQHGWNLFAYKMRIGLQNGPTGPGIDVPGIWMVAWAVAAAVPAVLFARWHPERPPASLSIPWMACLGLFLRAMTPVGEIIDSKVRYRANPDMARIVAFLCVWGVAGFGLMLGFDRLRDGLPVPAVLAGATVAAYFTIFLVATYRFEGRRKAREEEAAERGESGFPRGGVRL